MEETRCWGLEGRERHNQTSFRPIRFQGNPGLIVWGEEEGLEAKPRAPRKGDGQKSFHITSPLLGLRCPSSTQAHARRFQAPPPFWRGGYMRLKLNQDLETEAAGAKTPPPPADGIATEADFPLELPRAVLPLSQSPQVWGQVTGQKPGSPASHTCHSPGMQAHLLQEFLSRSPSASRHPAPRPSCHPLPLTVE